MTKHHSSKSSNSVEELLKAYEKLIYKEANKFNVPVHLHEDLIQEGRLGLLLAIERFDENKGIKLITYAYKYITGSMKRFIQKTIHPNVFNQEVALESHEEKYESRIYLKIAISQLSPIEQDVVCQTYGFSLKDPESQAPLTQEEIAQKWSVSRQTVHTIRKRALDKLRKILK